MLARLLSKGGVWRPWAAAALVALNKLIGYDPGQPPLVVPPVVVPPADWAKMVVEARQAAHKAILSQL